MLLTSAGKRLLVKSSVASAVLAVNSTVAVKVEVSVLIVTLALGAIIKAQAQATIKSKTPAAIKKNLVRNFSKLGILSLLSFWAAAPIPAAAPEAEAKSSLSTS